MRGCRRRGKLLFARQTWLDAPPGCGESKGNLPWVLINRVDAIITHFPQVEKGVFPELI